MDAEELVVDDGGQGQIVEEVHDRLVDLLVVLRYACVSGTYTRCGS